MIKNDEWKTENEGRDEDEKVISTLNKNVHKLLMILLLFFSVSEKQFSLYLKTECYVWRRANKLNETKANIECGFH